MEEILLNKPGKKILLLGNEAIVRGALEAGVNFVSTYPGTPASEIGNVFFEIAKRAGVYFEFSTNEKVATEAAAGASFSGLRSLVAMKNFGLNVASDFVFPLAYTGIKGGMVIFVADDTSCWSSAQSEQDTRHLVKTSHLPLLEPAEPQESKEFVKFAFELSEKFKIPVVIRHTTRTAHQSAPVILGKIEKSKRKAEFIKNPHQFVTMPPRVLEQKLELLEKIENIGDISEKSKLNFIRYPNQKPSSRLSKRGGRRERGSLRPAKLGIITSGSAYLYVMEALNELNLKLPVLKLSFIQPLPKKKIAGFLKKLKKVLVVEELDPYLESEIKSIAQEIQWKGKIFGKGEEKPEGGRIWERRKALLPRAGELKPEYILLAVAKLSGKKLDFNFQKHLEEFEKIKVPPRPPILCTVATSGGRGSCPYWLVISAIKKALRLGSGQAVKKVIFGGEIGCYMLFGHKVISLQDYLYCMGSDTGVAHGISKATNQKVIAFVGDSSFFHASIPALINTIFNKSNPLIIVMDNQTTAMTGLQPHPGAPIPADGRHPPTALKIEDICQACGVKNLKVIDPINQEEFTKTVKEFLDKKEVSVIISRRPCIWIEK